MTISISTSVKMKEENWDKMLKLVDLGFKNIEFYNKITRIRTADIKPLLDLKNKNDLNYSFHSMAQDLFCSEPIISHGEYQSLKGEIKLASLIQCSNFIFHISKKDILKDSEEKQIVELANFAKENGLKLCLENNFSQGPFSGDYLLSLLEKIENLFFCLDIGHFNIALNKGYINDGNSFLKSIKNKLAEVHISFNDGKKDQHLGISAKSENYIKTILNCFDRKKINFVIETRNIKQALKTKLILDKYV